MSVWEHEIFVIASDSENLHKDKCVSDVNKSISAGNNPLISLWSREWLKNMESVRIIHLLNRIK